MQYRYDALVHTSGRERDMGEGERAGERGMEGGRGGDVLL